MAETLQSIPATFIKMKWKEPYVTDGLNKKTAVAMPRGVYRGFKLEYDDVTPGGDWYIKMAGDGTYGDHVAVYETGINHHSLLVRWDIGDQLLDLNFPALLGQTCVIALYATYVVGSTTTAEIRAYTLAQYNVAAEKNELIVLGTVNVPAGPAPAPIPASDITHDRRVEPWSQVAPGAVFWSPVVRNGGFEWGEDGETCEVGESKRGLVPFWWLQTFMSAGNMSVGPSTSYSHSDGKSLLFKPVGGACTVNQVSVAQYIGMPVTAGKKIRARFYINVLQAMAGGQAWFLLQFLDKDGNTPAGTPIIIYPTVSAITGGWVEYDQTFEIPVGCTELVSVGFVLLNPGAFAAAVDSIALDDVQVWVQTEDPMNAFPFAEQISQAVWADTVFVGNWSGVPAFSRLAAQLRFNPTSPSGEGELILTSRDEDPSILPPRFTARGRLQLGEGLLSTLADTLKPRIAARGSTTAVGSRTLIYEGERSDAGTNGKLRVYLTTADFRADLEITTNAWWDGAQWNRDIGTNSYRYLFGAGSSDGYIVHNHPSTDPAPWLDTAWRLVQRSGASWGVCGIELGSGWLDTAANASGPREFVFRADTVTTVRTMIAMLAGEVSTGNPYSVCIYRAEDGFGSTEYYELAFNCTWDEATSKWHQSNGGGHSSTVFRFQELGFLILSVAGAHPVDWDEFSWDTSLKFYGLNPTPSLPYTNTVTLLNPCKAWGLIDDTTTGPYLQDGFNISLVSVTATEIKVTFATPMATAQAGAFCVTVANWYRNANSRLRNVIVKQSTASWVEFEVVNTATGALINPSTEDTKFSFAVHARQNSFP